MRHLEIRDLWLQKEVYDGKLMVHKVPGEENPADLMTKILGNKDIDKRLSTMNICVGYAPEVCRRSQRDYLFHVLCWLSIEMADLLEEESDPGVEAADRDHIEELQEHMAK
eukprot:10261528-Karenia_brevis.AAC.1